MRRHMDFFLFMFLTIGPCIGRWLHINKVAHEIANCEQRISEPITYTSGAAYDACLDEPTTDHDAVARKLLNW